MRNRILSAFLGISPGDLAGAATIALMVLAMLSVGGW